MKKNLPPFIRACIFLLSFSPAMLYSQFNYQWARGITGGEVLVDDMDEDAQGNIYVTGRLNGTADFDPGPAVANRTSTGNMDFFLAKYTSAGNLVWANICTAGFSGWGAMPFSIRVSGNFVYVAGTFIGNCDFDPGPGVANLTAIGNLGPFFSKYDLNGNYVWAQTVGSQNNDHTTGIDVDAAGNVYVSFVSGGTAVDFDPGPGVVAFPVNVNDGVFAKYDASGNYVFAKHLQSMGGGWHPCMDVAVDNAGNIYVTGIGDATVDLDPNGGTVNMTPAGGVDSYLAKYDATGAYVWHGQYSGTSDEVGTTLRMDNTGNAIYIGGYFSSASIDLDFGAGTAAITGAGAGNGFLAKYDVGSGGYLWGVNVNGNISDNVQDIDLDSCQNVYITGSFNSASLDVDPGPSSTAFATNGAEDFYIAKYTSAGAYVYGRSFGSPASDVSSCILLNAQNRNVSAGGYFNQAIDFDPGPATNTVTPVGANNGFMATYSESPPQPVNVTPPANLTICPGDNTLLIVNGSASGTVYWYDASGNLVGTGDSLVTGAIGSTTIFIFKDSLACLPASQPDTITVNVGNINLTLTASDTVVCIGEQVTLTGSGATSYTWQPGGNTSSSITIAPLATGPVTFTLIGQSGACSDTASITITVNNTVNLTVQPPADTICSGQSITLTASGASTYVWSPGGNTGSSISVSPVTTTTYTVIGNNGACTDTASVLIAVSPGVTVSLGPDQLVCDGSAQTLNGGTGQSYQWSNGATTQSIQVSQTGTYIETITNAAGCSATDSVFIQYSQPPQFTLDTMLICEGDSALFYVTGQSGSTFLWQNGSTDSVTWNGTPGPFWLQVTNSCGTSADTGLVILKPDPGNTQLPNVFTPNGDGINDTYFVAAMNGVDAYHLYIYNRWGRLLFDSGDYTEAWTGEGDNGIAPGGTYFVIATYQDCKGEAQQKNGTVQVIGDQP